MATLLFLFEQVALNYDLDSDINNQSATASIVNDDLHVATFAASAFSSIEGEPTRIIIEMDTPVTRSTRVYYEILNTGTATEGTDYTRPSIGYVQFVRNTYLPTSPRYATFTGDRLQIIEFDTVEDTGSSDNKTIDLRLIRTEGSAVLGGSNISTTATIIDRGAVPTLTIASKVNAIAEDAGPAMFTITAVGGNVNGKVLKVRFTPAEVGSGSFLSSTSQVSQDLTFTADAQGEFKQDISITLDDDDIREATGQVEVVLNDPASTTSINQFYQVGSQSTAQVTVWDNDAPELSIANGATIAEGTDSEAIFPVTAKVSPNKELTVRYTVSQPGSGYDFVASTGIATAELNFTGKTTANLEIAITNDDRVEVDGIVRVTLLADNVLDQDGNPRSIEYTVSSVAGENAGDVTVTDSDTAPELTIQALAPTSESLGTVKFLITSEANLGQAFKVRYQPSEVDSGNFLSDGSGPPPSENQEDEATQLVNFHSNGNNYTAPLAVPIHNDSIGEATGQIQVELLAGDNTTDTYVVATGNEEEQVAKRIQRATIYDDDTPELTIIGGDPVMEADGAMASFTVLAKVSPNDMIDVYYTVSDDAGSADFLAAAEEGPKDSKLDFSKNRKEASLKIPITSDSMLEGDGSISVELTADQTTPEIKYMVGTPATGTVAILEDDTLPVISLATDYKFVSPGDSIAFFVSIDPKPQTPITVPITARDETNDSLFYRPDPIIVGTVGTQIVRVPTFFNSTGNVTITLGDVEGYNSGPSLEIPVETPDNPATLTMTSASRPVAEGGMVTYTISADPTIDKDIVVEVDVIDFAAKGTDFVDNAYHYVRLPANADRATLSVKTKTDTTATTDGVIVATILDGSGYTHSSPTNFAYAEVQDAENTAPVELTVSAVNTVVYQEESIVFTISRTGDTTNELDFKYDLTDVEDVIDGEGNAIPGTIEANAASTQITLPTKSATTSYTDAAGVTLRLNSVQEDPSLEYRLGSATELKVGVKTATKPVITLSIDPNYIPKGESFTLVANATPAPIRPTSVKVNLTSEPPTYPTADIYLPAEFRGEQTIEIAADATEGDITVMSDPIGAETANGIINATLVASDDYSIPSEVSARTEKIGVLDNSDESEGFPELSIYTSKLYVSEDAGSFEVIIYTDFLPFVGLPLEVTSLTATEAGSKNYLGTYDFSNLEIGNSDEVFIHDRFRGIRATVPYQFLSR